MKMKRTGFFRALAVVLLLLMPAFQTGCKKRIQKRWPTCINADCHNEYLKKEYVHRPVKQRVCKACHVALTKEHPNEDVPDFDVDGAKLCFKCHGEKKELMSKAKVLHEPFKKNICIICHEPHASDNIKLLKYKQDELCFMCHEEFGKKIKSAVYSHTPVKKKKCTACHNPHGSDNRKMLKTDFPEKYNIDFNINKYNLCWNCHEKEMVLEATTSIYTDFRNGDMNLHYKHVNKEKKGKSCKVCHDIHAATQEANIRDEAAFGGSPIWKQPIKFYKTKTGGSCWEGCHKPKAYDRDSPIKYDLKGE